MSKLIDVHDLSAKIDEMMSIVASGDEVIVTERETPIAKLIPIPQGKHRTPGRGLGTMKMSPDFDEPLPDEFWLGKE